MTVAVEQTTAVLRKHTAGDEAGAAGARLRTRLAGRRGVKTRGKL